MKKQPVYFLVVMIAMVLAFASCKNNVDFKKTKSGIMYKIFGNTKDSVVKAGNIMKINYSIKIGSTDSVLQTSFGKMPLFLPVEGSVPPDAYSPLEVFNMLRRGDSAVIVQLIDTMMKKGAGQLPPFLKKGDKLITTVKVLEVYNSQEMAAKDREAEVLKEQTRMEKEVEQDLVKSNAEMSDWLAKKNIHAAKTGKGTFVEVKNAGDGVQAAEGKYVTVRYEGKTLEDGKVFQSTLDPKSPPYTFQLGAKNGAGSIAGFDEGLRMFKKGGKGTLYIPGPLAYGKNPPPGSTFKPNAALIFDIEMVDVSDTMPAQPQQPQLTPEMRAQIEKQMREQQQRQQPKK